MERNSLVAHFDHTEPRVVSRRARAKIFEVCRKALPESKVDGQRLRGHETPDNCFLTLLPCPLLQLTNHHGRTAQRNYILQGWSQRRQWRHC